MKSLNWDKLSLNLLCIKLGFVLLAAGARICRHDYAHRNLETV